MELTKYLTKEESWFPWDAAITSLSYVSSALKRTEAYGDFKVRTSMNHQYFQPTTKCVPLEFFSWGAVLAVGTISLGCWCSQIFFIWRMAGLPVWGSVITRMAPELWQGIRHTVSLGIIILENALDWHWNWFHFLCNYCGRRKLLNWGHRTLLLLSYIFYLFATGLLQNTNWTFLQQVQQ